MQEINFTYSELAKIAGSATHKTISKCITRKSSEIGEILGILISSFFTQTYAVLVLLVADSELVDWVDKLVN
jgi:hypothetical protein